MIPSPKWIHDKMKAGKLAIAYNGTVIVKMRAEELDGFSIDEITTGFLINYSKYIHAEDVVKDPQTTLTHQRPSSHSEHWHNAKNHYDWRRKNSGESS